MGDILRSLLRLGAPSLSRLSKSQKWSNMTKVLPNLGRGPTCPQHSLVTHPESLWCWKFCFERFELGSNCFNLLLCYTLFFSKFLNDYIFTGPSIRCYAAVLTYSSSTPWPCTFVNNWYALSCTSWSFWVISITLLWILWILYWAVRFSWDLFILSIAERDFSYACSVFACFFSS